MINFPLTPTYPGMPVASVIAFAGKIRSDSKNLHETNLLMFNWLLCDGREVKIAEYPELYQALGDLYGITNTSNSFILPDYRGMFLRGTGETDTTKGSDENRKDTNNKSSVTVGSIQSHALQVHDHDYKAPQAGSPLVADPASTSIFSIKPSQTESPNKKNKQNINVLTSNYETRPVNTSVNWLIKASM